MLALKLLPSLTILSYIFTRGWEREEGRGEGGVGGDVGCVYVGFDFGFGLAW